MKQILFQSVRAITFVVLFLVAAATLPTGVQAVTLDEVLQDVVTTNPRILEKQKAIPGFWKNKRRIMRLWPNSRTPEAGISQK